MDEEIVSDEQGEPRGSEKKTSMVYWSSLLSFLGALFASSVVVFVVYAWHPADTSLFKPLNGLGDAWKFTDSIVSNITAASGLVAVVLGSSDFLKAVLGSKAEDAIAVAAIAGLIAAALVGAAGVLVITFKKPGEKYLNAAGLCAGYVVAFGAAGGQVWTVTLLIVNLDLSTAATWIVWIAGICASFLLVAYASTSLRDLLLQGPKSETMPAFGVAGAPEMTVYPLRERSALP